MKTLLINGSPHEKGNAFIALRIVADSLEEEGIETEIYQIPAEPILGCRACHACKEKGVGYCVMDGDAVNILIDKIKDADALVIGSPVHYAGPSGQLKAILDRVFFAGSVAGIFTGKPASAVCSVRRGGATAALEVLQKYFTISGMPIAPTTYWPMIHGRHEGEAVQDEEGVQEMQMLGRTIAWLLKCIQAGKDSGLSYPEMPGGKKIMTNFIR